jgi:rSAM/selenodomain-associated transferase 1
MTTHNITTHLVIMAKAPVAGSVKTRLIPALGAQGAAELARRMLLRTVSTALAARGELIHTVTVCAAPDPAHASWTQLALPEDVRWSAQGEGDLGQRMAHALQNVLLKKEHVLLIGTDLPGLSVALLQDAARALHTHDVSLLPTSDGGYGLMGLRVWVPEIFIDMPWSTSQVCALTLQRLAQHTVHVGPVLHDIDEPQDLVHWPEPLGVQHA